MSQSTLTTEPPPIVTDDAPPEHPRRRRHSELVVAAVGFAIFAVLILIKNTSMLEPDDFAYRASIVALSHGQILLSNGQYLALQHQLSSSGGQSVLQWHHMASGKWISEKNPGYPFFAVVFYMIGLLRVAPLAYGALACVGLYAGARAWLGKWAGTYAVWLYCFSGAALVFAWRDTMASFTDASLIAAGFGALLWVLWRHDASPRRRLIVGALAFLALEGAVFIRYTNVIELIVAVAAVLVLFRRASLTWRTVLAWMTTVVLFGLGVLAFDQWAYGSATSTGYSAGEITFSLSSFWANLKGMPTQLLRSMPAWTLALAALAWIVVRLVRARRLEPLPRSIAVRDAVVAAVLAAGWLGLWILYLNYTWTVSMVGGGGGPGGRGGEVTVHVIRFYLPALGLIALLATWLLVRLRAWISWPVLGALAVTGLLSFHAMAGGQAAAGFGGVGRHGPVSSPVGSSTTHGTSPAGGYGTPPKGGKGIVPYGQSGSNPPTGAPPGGFPSPSSPTTTPSSTTNG